MGGGGVSVIHALEEVVAREGEGRPPLRPTTNTRLSERGEGVPGLSHHHTLHLLWGKSRGRTTDYL